MARGKKPDGFYNGLPYFNQTQKQFLQSWYVTANLEAYCKATLQASKRQHNEARYQDRAFMSPLDPPEKANSTGRFLIYDDVQAYAWRKQREKNDLKKGEKTPDPVKTTIRESVAGQYGDWVSTTWRDGNRFGNTFSLMSKIEGHKVKLSEAEQKIQSIIGLSPEQWWKKQLESDKNYMEHLSHRLEMVNQMNRERYYSKHPLERQAMSEKLCQVWAQRRQIELNMIKSITENGTFFKLIDKLDEKGMPTGEKELPPMPVQLKNGREYPFTSLNYVQAVSTYGNRDPRYMSKTEARKAGYYPKEDAAKCSFEYNDASQEVFYLHTWELRNATGLKGMPPYEDKRLSREEVMANIKEVLKANGMIDDQTPKTDDWQRNIRRLRRLCEKMTWNTAKVPGQRYLESEMAMTMLLHRCGCREPYQILHTKEIVDHLVRDANFKGSDKRSDDPENDFYQVSKNLVDSCIGADKGISKIFNNVEEVRKKELTRNNEEREETIRNPFKTLVLTTHNEITTNTGKRYLPPMKTFEGKEAYLALREIMELDKKMFGHYNQQGYSRPLEFELSFKGKKYDVRMEAGKLTYGNNRNAADFLVSVMTQKERNEAFVDEIRTQTVQKKKEWALFNLVAGNSKSYAKNMEHYREIQSKEDLTQKEKNNYFFASKSQEDTYSMSVRHQSAVRDAKRETKWFKEGEEAWLNKRTNEASDMKQKTKYVEDVYRYYIPPRTLERAECTNNPELLAEDIMRIYGAENILQVQYANEYTNQSEKQYEANKDMPGFIIETRQPLYNDGQHLYDEKRPETKILAAEKYVLDEEISKINQVDKNLTVRIQWQENGRNMQTESRGLEGATELGYLILEDREVYEAQQQSGTRSLEEATHPYHLTVEYKGKTMVEEDIYKGQLKAGNHNSVNELIWEQVNASKEQNPQEYLIKRQYFSEINQGLHANNKYSEEEYLKSQLKEQVYVKIPEAEREKNVSRVMKPRDEAVTHLSQLEYLDAMAKVNYRQTAQERADFIVGELQRGFGGNIKIGTLKKRIDEKVPELSAAVRKNEAVASHKDEEMLPRRKYMQGKGDGQEVSRGIRL